MIFNFRKRTQETSEKTTILNKIGRFLPYIFTFIIVLGVFLPTAKSFAQTPPPGFECAAGQVAKLTVLGNWVCNTVDAKGVETTVTKNGEPIANDRPATTGGGCGLFSPGKCAMAVLAEIAQFIMMAMGWLLWLSGVLLNYVIETTVVGMASGIKNMTGIDATWRVIRDVVNIFFIFILIYQGIRLIISQSDMGKIKTVIIGVVVTSVLMNFSVFFTKVIIDASNLLTVGFYSSIAEASKDQVVSVDSIGLKLNSGISGAFTNALKISTLFDPKTLTSMGSDADKSITIIGIGGSILFLVLSFIFFAISMMFIIRYVVFIILLMFSPLGFIFGIPGLESVRKKWWDALRGQAIFAPFYMFLTWAILTLISSPGFFSVDPSASYGKLFTGDNGASPTNSIGLVINFVVIIALAIFSLTKSKEFAKGGSEYISEYTGKLTTFAGGAIMGSAAVVGRRTIGAGADRLAQSKRFQDLAGSNVFAEKLLKGTRATASGSFDVRRSALGEQGKKMTGVDLGDGIPFKKDAGVGGFAKTVQQKMTDKEAFAKTLTSDQAKRDYALRQADKWYVRKGSRPNQAQTLFGTMGRANRIVASGIFAEQLKPLQDQKGTIVTSMDTQKNNIQNLENTQANLNQQLVTLESELASLTAIPPANRDQKDEARIVQLENPNGPKANIKKQIEENKKKIAKSEAQSNNLEKQGELLDDEIRKITSEIDRLGLDNPASMTKLTPLQELQNRQASEMGKQPIHKSRPVRADEQRF